MKKLFLSLLILLSLTSLFAENITFSGGSSRLVMKDSQKEVTLSGGAVVNTGSMTIKADTITISGNDYDKIVCEGDILIEDKEKGFVIKTSYLYFNRSSERIIISSYCEISDSTNELIASSNSLKYDLKAEKLTLSVDVHLVKASDDDIMSCRAEQMEYDRDAQTLALLGGAYVYFKENDYRANAILVDLETDEIKLEGNIRGNLNG